MIANFGCSESVNSLTFFNWKADDWTMAEEPFSIEKVQTRPICFYHSQHVAGLECACWFGVSTQKNVLHEGTRQSPRSLTTDGTRDTKLMKLSELTKFFEKGDVFLSAAKSWTISKAASLEGWWFHYQKRVLLPRRFSLFYFSVPTNFRLPECHQKGWKLFNVRF